MITTKTRVIFREGKRLYLRPPAKADIPSLVRWLNDPEVTQYLGRNLPMSEQEEEKWIDKLSERADRDIVFAIILKGARPEKDRLIGLMGVHGIDYHNRTATTGAVIGEKDCWGEGYGEEAKMLLLDFAFNTLNLRQIHSRVMATNPRSRAYSEKCGYRHVATIPQALFKNGAYVDEDILVATKESWEKIWRKKNKR